MFEFLKRKKVIIGQEDLIKLKFYFGCFFEGDEMLSIKPQVDIPISDLKITGFDIEYDKDTVIIFTIKTARVSMLIGRNGSTVSSLSKFLSARINRKVKINVVQSEYWERGK